MVCVLCSGDYCEQHAEPVVLASRTEQKASTTIDRPGTMNFLSPPGFNVCALCRSRWSRVPDTDKGIVPMLINELFRPIVEAMQAILTEQALRESVGTSQFVEPEPMVTAELAGRK
jgi:hypothetical protein